MDSIQIEKYFIDKMALPILDVRSPGEFSKGHFPGAFNIPLFSDDERAEVGTLYKQVSKEAAMAKGLDFAGKKLTWYIEQTQNLSVGKNVIIHCWRGGRRSASIATLLEFVGFHVNTIIGGYKSYRKFVLNQFDERQFKLIVLGGKTGSGKTDVLKCLIEKGEQVIDLEDLANHKGSAFGALGEKPQPTVEQFENNLFDAIKNMDAERRIWIENESKSIGRMFVPRGLWDQLCTSIYIELAVPFENRVDRLIDLYGHFPKADLINAIQKIQKRMGGQNVKKAIESFESGDVRMATAIALKYYDKTYEHASHKKPFSAINQLVSQNDDPAKTADELITMANDQKY